MKNRFAWLLSLASILLFLGVSLAGALKAATAGRPYDPTPPFRLDLHTTAHLDGKTVYLPRNPYSIFINYELGMHCVGFDISYCCIIPPYNSIQAQAVQAGLGGGLPRLLTPGDGVKLQYSIRDNTYSEGNKMKYWQVVKDVSGQGMMASPNDNMANYVWTHLFIYKDLDGTRPAGSNPSQRLHIGRQIPVNVDSGPSGKNLAGGYMEFAGPDGGNIVFTDSQMPEIRDIPLRLTSSHLWDALGLPLTAFNDSRRRGSIRTITDRDFQPYQVATVRLQDAKGKPVMAKGKPVEFFGTNPVDISNCAHCHSGKGIAATLSRAEGLHLVDREYGYWQKNYPDTSEYMKRLPAATIGILELHDRRNKTSFLKAYNPDAASNRLGPVGSVNCADCHGDNMSGNLQTPRPASTGYSAVRSRPLTEAVHSVHARFAPLPDKAGRTQNCQVCHPTHWQAEEMNEAGANPYRIADANGNPRFSETDLRVSGGGCYLRRDAHSNPDAKPPFFLNAIGKWFLREVSLKDEKGSAVDRMRGLYCTHCHNPLTHALYRHDDLRDAVRQEGKTLRNKPIGDVIGVIADGDAKRFKSYFADPVVGAPADPLYNYWGSHQPAPLMRIRRDTGGKTAALPWNAAEGDVVTYADASGGSDWWLAPAVPHCANCHAAPFVESPGGSYFPMDQPGKYSLYRYSKAHGRIACQSCHESMHGLYPVRYEGAKETVDRTSHEQALQFSPDGSYAGPVSCAACHTVNGNGVPLQLKGTAYYDDYWASVVLIHFMREEDRGVPAATLAEKYPYRQSRDIVAEGWR